MTNEAKSFDDMTYAERLKELRDFEERWGSPARLSTSKVHVDGIVRGGTFNGWRIWDVYELRRKLEKMH